MRIKIKREVAVINKLGLHARASAQLVKLASTYASDIRLTLEEQSVDGKNIMGLMMLAATYGSRIIVTAEGEDGATEPAACVCDAENGWTGEIISPADLCRRESGLGPGLIVLMSVAVGLGAALGAAGFLYRLRVSPMMGGN